MVLCLAAFALGFTLGALLPDRRRAVAVAGVALVAVLAVVAWLFGDPGAEEESAGFALLTLSAGLAAVWAIAVLLSALVRTRERAR
jgi:hypothetical protein